LVRMVKHNNVLPNVHFHKYWQRYVKTWFNQPGRKKSRRLARQKKAAELAPRPVAKLLRPVVHPPTQRYNLKVRRGRGFTLEELKEAGISRKTARTIGISVDWRRKNRSMESLNTNVDRLKEYKSKLIIFPRKNKAKTGDTERSEIQNVQQNASKDIIPIPKPSLRIKARAITDDDRQFEAYNTLRKAKVDAKYFGRREKRAREKAEAAEQKK